MKKKMEYSDKNWKIGKRVVDFLPAPDQLVTKEEKEKITLELSKSSLEFFKQAAKKQKVPYQRMIRALLDEYASRYK